MKRRASTKKRAKGAAKAIENRLGRANPERVRQQSPKAEIEEQELAAECLRLYRRHLDFGRISRMLGIPRERAARLIDRQLVQWRGDRDKVAGDIIVKSLDTIERTLERLQLLAFGGTVVDAKGKKTQVHADPKWTARYQRAVDQQLKMVSILTMRPVNVLISNGANTVADADAESRAQKFARYFGEHAVRQLPNRVIDAPLERPSEESGTVEAEEDEDEEDAAQ